MGITHFNFAHMTKRTLFTAAFLMTTVAMSVINYIDHRKSSATRSKLIQISDGVFITSQLHPNSLHYLKRRGIRTVVDIRPDGEDAEQPPSTEIEHAAKAEALSFYYIPVPHETIPDSAVDSLSAAMKDSRMPTVLYCRTGRRAVRLFALAEVARVDGPAADSIKLMMEKAGFSADDLQETIAKRINSRAK